MAVVVIRETQRVQLRNPIPNEIVTIDYGINRITFLSLSLLFSISLAVRGKLGSAFRFFFWSALSGGAFSLCSFSVRWFVVVLRPWLWFTALTRTPRSIVYCEGKKSGSVERFDALAVVPALASALAHLPGSPSN